MKILVLNGDLTERSVIQQVLLRNGHHILVAETSQAAFGMLQENGIRFIIADRTNTDMDVTHFIEHVRSAPLPTHVYILLISARGQDMETLSGLPDDYLFKPVAPADLKARVLIGERILALGDNLLRAKDQLDTLALLDPLTNLLNKKAYLPAAFGELERARRAQSPISVTVLGIDNFDGIKAVHGEEAGNDVLILLGQVLREKSRPYDCLGRWDTADFSSALPGVIGADAQKIAERVMTAIRSMHITPPDGPPLHVGMSAGIAAVNHITTATEIEPLIRGAQQAMLRAREAGGSQVFLTYI